MRTKNKFYILLTGIIFILTACSDDKEQTKSTETNITIPKHKESIILDNIISSVVNDSNLTKNQKLKPKKIEIITTSTFTFKNFENQISVLDVKNDVYNFKNISQPIVMINLSSTWCPPCRGEVPHLSSLQKKFKKELFILTALVHDNIQDDELKKLIVSEKAHFFVSTNQKENLKFEKMIIKKLGIVDNFNLPLMVLFNNGKYFTHYEGSMPEEMIESDIKQLLEKIKERNK